MFKLIKTNKYDGLVEKILLALYFAHQISFVFSASAFARSSDALYGCVSAAMIGTFLAIMLVCAYNLFRGFYSLKEIIIYAAIGIVLLISLYKYRTVMVIANLFAIAAFKNADWKKILKVYMYATVAGFIINVLFGIITPYTGTVIQGAGETARHRGGLGFYYGLAASYYYTSLVFVYILLKKKLNVIDYIVIVILNVIIFKMTDTKAPFGFVFLILIANFLLDYFPNKFFDNLLGFATILSCPFFFIATYFLSYYYNAENKIFAFINKMVTGRLFLTQRALQDFGFNLLGQDVQIKVDTLYPVDSSMMRMLMLNGLLVTIIAVIFTMYFSYISYKTKEQKVMLVILFICARACFDLGFFAMQFSPIIFLFYPILYKYLKQNSK